MKHFMNLKLFDGEGGAGGSGGQGSGAGSGNGGQGGSGNATYSYEQAEEIANARADRATKAALSNYFRQQGMTEDEVTQALNDFKARKDKSKPDVSAITKERDDAVKELESMKHTNYLRDKGVSKDDLDYVMYKASQMVDDKTDFEHAADKFLKENPRYSGQGRYRAAGSVKSGSGSGSSQTVNETINDAIRNAFKR